MDGTKKWYQSTIIWNCVVIGVIGIYESLIASGVHLPAIPPWIITILGALGIYRRVTTTDKIA